MLNKLIKAELVWDGSDEVHIPSCFESHAPNQMLGTAHERLGEISAALCYDSRGLDPATGKYKGRSTDEMHIHLREVDNTSVYEHCTFTVSLTGIDPDILATCLINRPGVWVECENGHVDITLNHRSVLEWDDWNTSFSRRYQLTCTSLGRQITKYAATLAPRLYPHETPDEIIGSGNLTPKIKDLNPHEAWVSLYISGSRGFSHEQCRHGNFTAISQRSSRFCSEGESPYVTHPLTEFYRMSVTHEEYADIQKLIDTSITADRLTYDTLTNTLQKFLVSRGVQGTNARKQARGAARGYLGNALFTEMIFSASAAQWTWMLGQRASIFADAEIRELYAPGVLTALKQSRYAHFFHDLILVRSPDGIGQIVVRAIE